MSSVAIPLALLGRIHDLKRLPRMGWIFSGIRMPESVADHTSSTALLSVFLAQAINEDPAAEGLSTALDVGKVAHMALVHDLAESVLTDLPKRSAELLTKEVKHAAEAKAMEQILVGIAGGRTHLSLWVEYRDQTSPEARLIHDADKLDLVYQALSYEQQGVRSIDDYWQGHSWAYAASAAIFETICQERPA